MAARTIKLKAWDHPMKHALVFALLASLFALPVEATEAQPPKKIQHSNGKAKPTPASGDAEAIMPQELPSKDMGSPAGWNGSYVGVSAGMGFGATAGSNLVLPLGPPSKSEK